MTYPELLDAINVHNIKLELKLVIDAPSGVITDELRCALTEHKPHLLAKLGRDAQWGALSQQRWGPALNPPTRDKESQCLNDLNDPRCLHHNDHIGSARLKVEGSARS
jgi:hypothetical protein